MSGPTTRRLTDLDDPPTDWVRLSEGFGVSAGSADTVGGFEALLRAALGRGRGPSLIEALLL